jgi:hypothetical protein
MLSNENPTISHLPLPQGLHCGLDSLFRHWEFHDLRTNIVRHRKVEHPRKLDSRRLGRSLNSNALGKDFEERNRGLAEINREGENRGIRFHDAQVSSQTLAATGPKETTLLQKK